MEHSSIYSVPFLEEQFTLNYIMHQDRKTHYNIFLSITVNNLYISNNYMKLTQLYKIEKH